MAQKRARGVRAARSALTTPEPSGVGDKGVLSDEVRELLVRFFKELRQSPPQPPIVSLTRRGTRVDNGDGLENGCGDNPTAVRIPPPLPSERSR